ncbi:pyruvate formate-lyase-activating protein [Leptolyngbya sp. KIOST-1]|uniref:pyruvate formate-lyase-activating protein n=1 Tax=Leptolyngbya sp. KIOST-1 TaxID=1229172 RepID=UPI0005658F8B|nr:pyruvate formate-lyase-activating protein [Leptolyngbya sp. KIOST-1]
MSPSVPTRTQTGRIHSLETCGTVDGPGIRFVVFTQGCPLRCLYCHNPDCQEIHGGTVMTVDEIMAQIDHTKTYLRKGGVTVSGGEPLMQPEFVAAIFRRCHEMGLHTALDTSGYVHIEAAEPVLDNTDLVLLDIKSYNADLFHKVTSVSIEPTLNFARYLAEINKPTWIRFVLVPGLTDPEENVVGLAKFVGTLDNVERVEVLPFHKMGEYKWQQLGLPYTLGNTQPPTPALVEHVIQIFRSQGLTAV